MQRYTRLKEDAAEDDLALTLVADAEIYRLDSVIRWLDSADARLKRDPRTPPRRGEPRATVASEPQPTRGAAMTSLLELRQVSKVYGTAPNEVHALPSRRSLGARRRARRRSWVRAARARARC